MGYATEPQDAIPENEQPVKTAVPDGYAEYQQFLQWKAAQAQEPVPQDELPPPDPILTPEQNQQDISVEKGQIDTAIRSGQISEDQLARLLARLDDLEKQVADNRVTDQAGDGIEGGAPVPHHLHLSDGTVITDHPGIVTHYATPDGLVRRVVNAFRSDESVTRGK